MSVRVETFPQGLRELLGRGDPPQQLQFINEFFLPTLDLEKYLLLAQRRTEELVSNVTVVGGFGAITVPDNELWFIHYAQYTSDLLDADQAISFVATMRINGVFFNGPRVDIAASTRDGSRITDVMGPLILKPGDRVQGNIDTVTVGAAGSVGCLTDVLYSLLKG